MNETKLGRGKEKFGSTLSKYNLCILTKKHIATWRHCDAYGVPKQRELERNLGGTYIIGIGSGETGGELPPPPNFTHCLHNELHCNIIVL